MQRTKYAPTIILRNVESPLVRYLERSGQLHVGDTCTKVNPYFCSTDLICRGNVSKLYMFFSYHPAVSVNYSNTNTELERLTDLTCSQKVKSESLALVTMLTKIVNSNYRYSNTSILLVSWT